MGDVGAGLLNGLEICRNAGAGFCVVPKLGADELAVLLEPKKLVCTGFTGSVVAVVDCCCPNMNVFVVVDNVGSFVDLLPNVSSVVPNFGGFVFVVAPKVVLVIESAEFVAGNEKPEEPNLMPAAGQESLAGLIPKLIEEEGVVRVAAAATRVENFVFGSLDKELSSG
jgi:hypothetical protein